MKELFNNILIQYSVLIAVFSYVYVIILTDNEMLLNSLYLRLNSVLPKWLFNPLIGCVYCNAGQLALWSYFFLCSEYNIFYHIFFISNTIFLVEIFNKKINK